MTVYVNTYVPSLENHFLIPLNIYEWNQYEFKVFLVHPIFKITLCCKNLLEVIPNSISRAYESQILSISHIFQKWNEQYISKVMTKTEKVGLF